MKYVPMNLEQYFLRIKNATDVESREMLSQALRGRYPVRIEKLINRIVKHIVLEYNYCFNTDYKKIEDIVLQVFKNSKTIEDILVVFE